MQIDLRVPICAPVSQVVEFARQCEEAGFGAVGLPDTQLLNRDVFIASALVCQGTSRIRVAPMVTNPVTRHPTVIASAAATISEIAPNRFDIILGSGYSSVELIGQRAAKMAEMREAVQVIKRLLRGEDVHFGEKTTHMAYRPVGDLRVYVAATNPKLIEVAGEVADGVMVQVGVHPQIVEKVRAHVAAGARRAGRNSDEIDLVFCARSEIAESRERALERMLPHCVEWIIQSRRARWLRLAGIDLDGIEVPDAVYQVYPELSHAENAEEARRACAFLDRALRDRIADIMGICGPPDYAFERFAEWESWGIQRLYLMTSMTYELPYDVLRAFQDRKKS